MSEPMTNQPRDERMLEESLKAVLSHRPDPAFVDRLEQRLLATQSVNEGAPLDEQGSLLAQWRALWAGMRRPAPRLRWAVVPLLVVGLLLASVLLIGPERAWAGLQAWLGYVPGVGFVDLEESRLLATPASVTREGVTLRVEQVVAGPEETVVVIDSDGLPPREQLWPDGREPFEAFEAWLRLPDGTALRPSGRTMRVGSASLVFPPLPPDVYRVTLELPRLPIVPAGAAPEEWTVPLLLQPASGEVVASMYPQPYRPQGAVESHQGVTLRVLEVAHDARETAVQIQLDWENPEWENHFGPAGFRLPYLRDDEGNRYNLIPGSTSGSQTAQEVQPLDPAAPTPPANRWLGSETFEPVPPDAEALTLVVDGVDFDVPASGSFTVDLGESPHIGDRWELNVTLDVAGFPVRVTGAELAEEEIRLRDGILRQTVLRFDVEPVAEQENRRLMGIFLDAPGSVFDGGATGYTPATNKIRASLELDEGTPVPAGQINVELTGASLLVRGPWELTWPVRGADVEESERLPQTYAPQEASTTQAGVTLSVLAAAHSNEEIALQVQAGWQDARWSWNGLGSPNTDLAPWLQDEAGRIYRAISPSTRPLRVEREVIDTSQTPTPPPAGPVAQDTAWFEPPATAAQVLTLNVPRLSFSTNLRDAFTVDLGPNPQVGDSWPLDVNLDVAGFPVQVTGVRLEEGEDEFRYTLAFETEAEQGEEQTLEGLTLGLGEGVDYGNHLLARSVRYSLVGELRPTISIEKLPESPFTVIVDYASMDVQGPWEVSWEVFR
ncbi:MAG: hypothetical protein ACOCXI_16465 [Chloroflexota bacterium]